MSWGELGGDEQDCRWAPFEACLISDDGRCAALEDACSTDCCCRSWCTSRQQPPNRCFPASGWTARAGAGTYLLPATKLPVRVSLNSKTANRPHINCWEASPKKFGRQLFFLAALVHEPHHQIHPRLCAPHQHTRRALPRKAQGYLELDKMPLFVLSETSAG